MTISIKNQTLTSLQCIC